MNETAKLKFKVASYDVPVQHVNHYAIGTPSPATSYLTVIIYKQINIHNPFKQVKTSDLHAILTF